MISLTAPIERRNRVRNMGKKCRRLDDRRMFDCSCDTDAGIGRVSALATGSRRPW